uniref:Uncharacterized protein LOC104228584 n=1 Tax=Nicotiana sylvestris TaxID=4096 RepID=A0A1U7WLB7_NICSY|nr:PREDICTED: uncharacterized protein LOC104228584 [Nicotiana sylvestris]
MAGKVKKGEIAIPVYMSGTVQNTKFHVIGGDMKYNELLGRPWIHSMRAMPSTLHQMMKFPTKDGITTVYGEQHVVKEMLAVYQEAPNPIHSTLDESRSVQTPEDDEEIFSLLELLLPPKSQMQRSRQLKNWSKVWTLFTDGATNVRGSGLVIVLQPSTGGMIRQSIKTTRLTNNEAEYEAMIAGLKLAKILGAKIIEAKWDSLLVINQVNVSYEVREDMMQRYLDKIHVTLRRFKEWTLVHKPREQNSEADALTNLGSSVEEDYLLP